MTFFKSKRTIFLLYFLSGLLISKPIFANNFYQEQLILKAKELKLSQDSKWLNMLYYEKNKLSKGYESIFDSENFFLSKDGRKNPGLELEATIRSFFDENHLSFNNIYKNKQYAQCAFQGRYQWLKKRLNFDLRKLKQRKCNDFNKWHKSLNPQSATLVFASAYLNNPASMFGHTFLLNTYQLSVW